MARMLKRLAAVPVQAVGVVLMVVLLGLTRSHLVGPPKRRMRRLAEVPEARARRDAVEQEVLDLVGRLGEVEGLEHVRTDFSDSVTRALYSSGNFGSPTSRGVERRLRAVAWFAVRDGTAGVAEVLERVRVAGVGDWLPVPQDRRVYRPGLGYVPDDGPDPEPEFGAPGFRLDWDRPGAPLSLRAEERAPRRGIGTARLGHRRWSTPPPPPKPARARARHGALLLLCFGGPGFDSGRYFRVDYRGRRG
ncbi:hypothetical protein [Kitasatospora sp. NPDC057198]|uniref:hypothetical protein n=1 Tax=Kitasatospora sp. NPDC057198 TaxID=3346046 RepID=UPI00363A754F